MSIFESIVNHFNEHLDLTSKNIENLTPYIAEAAHLFTESLLADKKIICCTSSGSYSAGIQFCHNLANSIGMQRPALPVLFLGANPNTLISMIDNQSPEEIYSKNLQSLGNKDDILFIISIEGNEKYLLQAKKMAHEKLMPIVILSSSKSNELTIENTPTDVIIKIESELTQNILTIQFLISLILTQLIEQQLFGIQQS